MHKFKWHQRQEKCNVNKENFNGILIASQNLLKKKEMLTVK